MLKTRIPGPDKGGRSEEKNYEPNPGSSKTACGIFKNKGYISDWSFESRATGRERGPA